MKLSAQSHDTADTVEEGYPMPLEVPPDDEPDQEDEHLTAEELAAKREIVAALLKHSYHLPHHNLYQDWWQYLTNNHPVFGMCLHHKYHPLNWKVRLISLIGSMLLGLALTNFCYLAFVFVDQSSEQTLLRGTQLIANSTGNAPIDQAVQQVSVTTGNLVLWFVGAPIHGIYDSIAWALMGCACCRFHSHDSLWARLCRTSGAFMVTFGVICLFCLASLASLLRAAVEADEDLEITLVVDTSNMTGNYTYWGANYSEVLWGGNNTTAEWFDNTTQFTDSDSSSSSSGPNILDSPTLVHTEFKSLVQEQDFENYKFVVSFFVELLLNYIIFYPIVATVFFSGVLSCCGRYPLFHGRQYEIEQLRLARKEAEEAAAMEPGVEVRLGGDNEDKEDQPLVEKEPTKRGSKKAKQDTKQLLSKEEPSAKAAASKKPKRESTKTTTMAKQQGESTKSLSKQQQGESTKSLKTFKAAQGESTKSPKKSKATQGESQKASMDKPVESSTKKAVDKPATTTKKAKRESTKNTKAPDKVEDDKPKKAKRRESKTTKQAESTSTTEKEKVDEPKKAKKRESMKDSSAKRRESTRPKKSKEEPAARKPVAPPPPPPPPSDDPPKKKKKRASQAAAKPN